MAIDRDEQIRFDESGTLDAVTRWITSHDEGVAEWLKNARRAYQADRANVAEDHRAVVLLLKDEGGPDSPARIGLLDVGGATLEDVEAWSIWQDQSASSRGSAVDEEATQGNGGKAYMYRLFEGTARIVGVRDGRRNCKGFEGKDGTVERGTPGFIPNTASGKDLPIVSTAAELASLLKEYDVSEVDLPSDVCSAFQQRDAFTLVEGANPIGFFSGKIEADDLASRVLRHSQSALAIEQLAMYVLHNGSLLNNGLPLQLPPIDPYPGLEQPYVFEIPERLRDPNGDFVSSTEDGAKAPGRLVLHTSLKNMWTSYKNLRPRWRINYRTEHQMIGTKTVSQIAAGVPGAQFIYGEVTLPALEPDYVEHGRRSPLPGPLMDALDAFIAEKIRDVAREISEKRTRELDARALDEVHEANQRLDEIKNRFLPSDIESAGGEPGGQPGPNPDPPVPGPRGTVPHSIQLEIDASTVRIGRGVHIDPRQTLRVRVRDVSGRVVPNAKLDWIIAAKSILEMTDSGMLVARRSGNTELTAKVRGTSIQSRAIEIDVWEVDHVLLTPRSFELPIGKRRQVSAEVTDVEGRRAMDVLLTWAHSAEDQLIVRIDPRGTIIGNRVGKTEILAGAGQNPNLGIWARIPAVVEVIENPDISHTGSGHPRLLVTDRDIDPATGHIRPGDPDSPALWQETTDFLSNIWWLNLQSPEAAYAFGKHDEDPVLWRHYHIGILMEMVVQIYMRAEFTSRGEHENPDYWSQHKTALDRHRVQVVEQMWGELNEYVSTGDWGGLT